MSDIKHEFSLDAVDRLRKDRDEWRELARMLMPALVIDQNGVPAVAEEYLPMSEHWHRANALWEKKINEP